MPISDQHIQGLKHRLLQLARTEPTIFAGLITDVFANIKLRSFELDPEEEEMIQDIMDKYASVLQALAKGPES